MVTTLKIIQVSQISPSAEQPRENFDKEKIKELAESILSNGLINPITVRKEGSKFFIVAGERRWRAHKVAGLKTIDAFVKEYKDEGIWMVESLIENVQREDLNDKEKAKFLKKIMEIKNTTNISELSRLTGMSKSNISSLLDVYDYRSRENDNLSSFTTIRATSGFEDKERKQIIKFAEDKNIPARKLQEKIIPIYRKFSHEVKDALIDDKITIEQAERISKLKTEAQRKKAIQEHKSLVVVEKGIERNVKRQTTAKEKREFDKRLVQANNWIASFRGSVVDTHKQIEKTIKILLVSTKFIPAMDETQLKKLNNELEDFIEVLERGEQLATQIQEKI